jgi:hypothetical protein
MDGQPERAVGLGKKLGQGKALKELLIGNQLSAMDHLTTEVTRRTLHGGQGNREEIPCKFPEGGNRPLFNGL